MTKKKKPDHIKCPDCGGRVVLSTKRDQYDIGLDRKVKLWAIEVGECDKCGEWYEGVPNTEGLYRTIALEVAGKTARLTPRELRFLRNFLGQSIVDFADEVGVKPETISRWERVDKPTPVGLSTERLLRLLVFQNLGAEPPAIRELGAQAAKVLVLPPLKQDKNGKWVVPEPYQAKRTA